MSKYKGDLEGFPEEIVEAMLEYQEEHGNGRDVTVFEKDRFLGVYEGGFTWRETVEGYNFWEMILQRKDFDIFFDKYPKKEVTEGLVKEPMRCRIDLGGGNKVEFLVDSLDINFDKGYIDLKAK